MQENKVFSSSITRGHKPPKNNLYDLINVTPAIPRSPHEAKERKYFDFQPKTDKFYVPKKNKFSKVKTVREVRKLFEADTYPDLTKDIETQQNLLFKKIRGGSSREENTKSIAKNMLQCSKPISRSSWQMLMNLNPDGNLHAIQYVLWNGRLIRVNGSKGGKNKFSCNYDISKFKPQRKNKAPTSFKKKGLLQSSLSVKFKPGPLSKKECLDNSHQKYNVGTTELVKLPKPGLNIRPILGVALDPTITRFVQNMRDSNGTISEEWAELSVSVLGAVKDSSIVQEADESGVTFELNYKCNQNRLLMRRDEKILLENDIKMQEDSLVDGGLQKNENEAFLNSEIKHILAEMIACVETSLQQDTFTLDDEPRAHNTEDSVNSIVAKEKVKRKHTELSRLDVTVISLPEDPENEDSKACDKLHCSLGCICTSLRCSYRLKSHCGRIECMFECKCNFSKYKMSQSLDGDSHLIPGLITLDKELNSRLAKEEQKFHQTVVMTGEKSILLKSQRRNWKAPKRYGEFYSNMCLKGDLKTQQVLSVSCIELNLENIEPWCMVHNLYKCFCKGKFTQGPDDDNTNKETVSEDESVDNKYTSKHRTRSTKTNVDKTSRKKSNSENGDVEELDYVAESVACTCARIKGYGGRKYKDSYYNVTNKRIIEMEKNDGRLRKRMLSILSKGGVSDTQASTPENMWRCNLSPENNVECHLEITDNLSRNLNEVNDDTNKSPIKKEYVNDIQDRSILQSVSNKSKLISWLESSYKLYKQRSDHGIIKKSLDAPKHGKVALYPWEFILSRYRERKNLFLISKHEPFRIFMAVDAKNSLFQNCINIDDIRFADLHKYPITIKNLLTNASDLIDNFCILCGLSHCWELVGSVTKLNEKDKGSNENKNVNTVIENITHSEDDSNVMTPDKSKTESSKHISLQVMQEEENNENDLNSYESSKWFIMTVENDFSEIQFYKRGFFVKYESIIKAINVARMSGKTVRLSSQKCTEVTSGPQFGIYAIPNANEYYVFVGPYDKGEPLAIETVKTISDVRKLNRTRGVWITTKKVDNIKVIDNPESFMPPSDLPQSNVVSLDSTMMSFNAEDCRDRKRPQVSKTTKATDEIPKANVKDTTTQDLHKAVKPISTRKSNRFLHLNPQTLVKTDLETTSLSYDDTQTLVDKVPIIIKNRSSSKPASAKVPIPRFHYYKSHASKTQQSKKSSTVVSSNSLLVNNRPVAEIAPQMKVLQIEPLIVSGTTQPSTSENKSERSMFILKPEEINKRLLEKSVSANLNVPTISALDQDIENFLATSTIISSPPNADIFEISDEDGDNELVDNVWIECQNYEFLGWLKGRKNADNKLSFEFPGFKFTDFYDVNEAFSKINQVLSRKICVPKSMILEWRVVESAEDLKVKRKLEEGNLGSELVLTKRGIRHKSELMIIDKLSDLEDQSKILEDENDVLMKEMEKSVLVPIHMSKMSDDQRQQIAQNLQSMMAANNDESNHGDG